MRKRSVLAAAACGLLAATAATTVSTTTDSAAKPLRPARVPSSTPPATSSRVGSAGLFDARSPLSRQAQAVISSTAARVEAGPAVTALRTSLGRQSLVDIDGTTSTPRIVAKLNGFLTRPSRRSAAAIALGYVRAHAGVFRLTGADLAGLRLARDYVDVDGTSHLSWTQDVGGVPLFGNGLKANVTRNGRLINVEGSPVAHLRAPSAGATLTRSEAITAAKANLGAARTAPGTGDVVSRVLFSIGGNTRSAYQVTAMSVPDPALLVVDAQSGRVLFREPLSADAADSTSSAPKHETAKVFQNYPLARHGGAPALVDLTAKGWLAAGAKTLSGNNTHTYSDINDNNRADSTEEVAPNSGGTYVFAQKRFQVPNEPCSKNACTWVPSKPFSWRTNRRQTSTQNFYFINKYHDHLLRAPIGFTEAAGNFQRVNHSGKGKGGDAVLDEPLDGANTNNGLPDAGHIDNANFATPPDGQSPRMQMYLWHYPKSADPFIASSGSDEADIVYHEYTHGLSHRLVVNANNVPALDSQQGASMGEAWSDWYALDYLVDQGYFTDTAKPGEIEIGKYVLPGENFRSEPTDCPVGAPAKACPGTPAAGSGGYTYGDFGKIASRGPEVHADGEIWAQTLWDLRGVLGSTRTESIVTRGMELSPTFPSYLDMRNAIIQADVADHGGVDVTKIWRVFAHRGMGYFAGTIGGDDVSPVQNFSMPPKPGTPTGTVHGTVTNNLTGAPVRGAVVAFGGHDSGLPGSYATRTDANGNYRITKVVAGTYPDVYAGGAGFNTGVRTVKVTAQGVTESFALVRDWASTSGGAKIAASNGKDGTIYGCGPSRLLDQSVGIGWSTAKPASGGRFATIKLPRPVNITRLQVDPTGTCGDDLVASAAQYTIKTSTDGSTFATAASGRFRPSDTGHLVTVPLASGTGTGVTYIRYTILTNQAAARGVSCPSSNDEGCPWFDSRELEVFGRAAPPAVRN